MPDPAGAAPFPRPPQLRADLEAAGELVLEDNLVWEGLSIGADFARQVAEDPVVSGCQLKGAGFVGSELVRARIIDTVRNGYFH